MVQVDDANSRHVYFVGDYFRIAARYWWALVIVLVVPTLVAGLVAQAESKQYVAEATLLYSGAYTDATALTLEVGSVDATLKSVALEADVAKEFGGDVPAAGSYSVSAQPVASVSSAGALGTLTLTRVVKIVATSGDPALSARVANAYAEAFVQYRTALARDNAKRSLRVVRQQIADLEEQAATATAVQIDLIASTTTTLRQREAELAAAWKSGTGGYSRTTVAVAPATAASPQPAKRLALGLGVGIFLAVLLPLVLLRFGRRVASARELSALIGAPVVGTASPCSERSGRPVLDRRLSAMITMAVDRDGVRSIVFAPGNVGTDTSVAALAAGDSLARSGRTVLVMEGDLQSPSLDSAAETPAGLGLRDVLHGRAGLDDAVSDAAIGGVRSPRLALLTAGQGDDGVGEALGGRETSELFANLEGSFDVILVTGPPLLSGQDAFALLSAAQATLLEVDLRKATRSDVRECADLIRLSRSRLIGVVLSRGRRAAKARRTRGLVTSTSAASDAAAVEEVQ